MTADARLFQRQARLVSHSLEVFLHLQEMNFDDPRVLTQGLTEVIDQTVRCLFHGIFLSVISNCL